MHRFSATAFGLNLLRTGFVRCKSTKSSTNWLARQARDPYVKQRSGDGEVGSPFRARSAFKLTEIQKKYRILHPGQVVCDLGAAPGGWSQVAARHLKIRSPTLEESILPDSEEQEESISSKSARQQAKAHSKLVAVDLLDIPPIPGVQILQGDFTSPHTQAAVSKLVGKRGVDVVLSDMCANVSGNTVRDTQSSLELCEMAFGFAETHLRGGDNGKRSGALVMKYFEHPILLEFMKEKLQPVFGNVRTLRLEASRTESKEQYFLCTGFHASKGPAPA